MLNIKTIRQRTGMTQYAVAEKLSIARSTYTNIENGISDPDTGLLLKLSRIFNCSIDELFGIEVSPATPDAMHTELLHYFDCLNIAGQQLVIDYVAMLAGNENYTKETASTVSA